MIGGCRSALGLLALSLAVLGCSSKESGTGVENETLAATYEPETLAGALQAQPALLISDPEGLLVGDGQPDTCGVGFTSSVTVVDPIDGSIRWHMAVPWSPLGAVVIDSDTLVVVGEHVDDVPPSVAGINLGSGTVKWQRFLAAARAELVASNAAHVAISVGGQLLLVDADGSITADRDGAPTRLRSEFGEPFHPLWTRVGLNTLVDPVAEPLEYIKFDQEVFVTDPLVIRDVALFVEGPSVGLIEAEPFRRWVNDDIPLDDEFSYIVDVLLGDDEVLVLVGSDLGPNRRLVVLELVDGRERWVLDGVRAAAAGEGHVIYDVRNSTLDGYGPTRDVVVVDDQDPSIVLWSAPSMGPLGGYVGSSSNDYFFLSEPDPRWPSPPYPDTGPTTEIEFFDPEFVVISGDPSGIEMLRQPGRDQLAPGQGVVADEWMAAIGSGGVTIRSADGTEAIVEGTELALTIFEHNELLIISSGRPQLDCSD